MVRNIGFKTLEMQRTERWLREPIEDYLRRRYITERLSQREIARDLGIDVGTVCRWMGSLGIEARPPGRHRKAA